MEDRVCEGGTEVALAVSVGGSARANNPGTLRTSTVFN